MTTRRTFTKKIALSAALAAHAPFLKAQANTARLVLGFPPGSTFDAFTRRVAEQLRGKLAPTVIVDNKPGAGGQIALTSVRDGVADGSSILVSPSSLFTVNPFTYKTLTYKNEDVKPVAIGVVPEPAFAVGPAVPERVKTLKDFIEWTKQNPTGGSYASPAAGSILHLIGAYIGKVSNVNWQHVAYRGAPPAMQDLLGGQVPALVLPVGEFLPFMKTGKIRVLAVSSNAPSVFMPAVPTLRQSGIPLSARDWYGFFLPATASDEVVRRSSTLIQTALAHPEMASWAETVGLNMYYKGPADTVATIKSEMNEWRELIKVIGFTADS